MCSCDSSPACERARVEGLGGVALHRSSAYLAPALRADPLSPVHLHYTDVGHGRVLRRLPRSESGAVADWAHQRSVRSAARQRCLQLAGRRGISPWIEVGPLMPQWCLRLACACLQFMDFLEPLHKRPHCNETIGQLQGAAVRGRCQCHGLEVCAPRVGVCGGRRMVCR